MKALRELEIALSSFSTAPLRGGFSPPVEMKRYTHELERRRGAPDYDMPLKNQREPMLMRLLAQHSVESPRDLKYICYGLADPIGQNEQQVLSDTRAFSVVLQHVQSLEQSPRLRRKCYLGLLSSYFEFNILKNMSEAAESNWLKLRDYLNRNLAAVSSAMPVPQWAVALDEHRNLLGDNPCERYAKQLLDGKSAPFDEMRSALNISGKSWVVPKTTLAAIKYACREPEDKFRNRISTLIATLRQEEYKIIRTPALAKILATYAAMRNHPEHQALRDFAVDEWGNPLLRKNQNDWITAGQAATDMVALWMKRTLIEDFFELLSADGKTDQRRVRFWQRYVEAVDTMYFALGRSALSRNRADLHRLYTMSDNFLWLDGGSASNNGFFMVIGDYLIAEFGEKGNAAFIFKKGSLPFRLDSTVSLSNRTRWSDTAEIRLRHFDRAHAQWEEDFEDSLRQIVGVTPSSAANLRRPATGSAHPQPQPQQAVAPVALDKLRGLCAQNGLRCEDQRAARCFYVYASDRNKRIAALLTEHSFKYDESAECWHQEY